MSIYIFSQGIGCKTDSIDYIRIYKKCLLNDASDSIKYIFAEVPERKEIDNYSKIGIKTGQLVNMYQFFTDKHTLELSVKTEDKLKELNLSWLRDSTDKGRICYCYNFSG